MHAKISEVYSIRTPYNRLSVPRLLDEGNLRRPFTNMNRDLMFFYMTVDWIYFLN